MAVDKTPQVLKEKWWFYVDDKYEKRPDRIMFEKWYLLEKHTLRLQQDEARLQTIESPTQKTSIGWKLALSLVNILQSCNDYWIKIQEHEVNFAQN